MNETLLLGGVLSLLVVIGVTTLAIAARTLRSARRAERGGNERLEILREQQERLKLMYQERRMLEEELKRERDRRAQLERALFQRHPATPGRVAGSVARRLPE
jgi:biopolymer transport protein ExbB/TolQ